MCIVKSGVLQGCPLAALLFVMAMEPFVCLFERTISSRSIGVVSPCADDIAVVLKNIEDLLGVYIVFVKAQLAAGLTLKPRKCNLVPSPPRSLTTLRGI